MASFVKEKAAGQELTTADWNAVADAANRTLKSSGSRVMKTPLGLLISGDKEFLWPKPSTIVSAENISDDRIFPLDIVQITYPFNLQGADPQQEGTTMS